MSMVDIWRMSATEIAKLVKGKNLSAREVAMAALQRIEQVNPLINAIVDCNINDVLGHADRLDARIRRGENVGDLAGVPVTIKVNVDQRGYATTNGLLHQKDLIAENNSPVVDSLIAADAIPIGRTNNPAFCYRWFTSNRLHGATKNPRNPCLTPGGSSGGAAAAVASGMGALAHGTDIAGSIRYPAYACGVHGLRPSSGRVAAYNASSGEREIGGQLMAVSGPLARSIDDLRIALKAMARPDIRDPMWVPAPLIGSAVEHRVALCLDPCKIGTSPVIKGRLIQCGKLLAEAGWQVEEVEDLPALNEAADLQLRLWIGDNYEAKLNAAQEEGDIGALTVLRGHATLGKSLTLSEFSNVFKRRAALMREWNFFFEKYPVVLMPVSADLPFEDNYDLKSLDAFERVWKAQIPQIGTPFMGLPGLSVFTGFDNTTPTGVQVVANRFREDLCLDVGNIIERSFGAPPLADVT